MCLGVHFRDFTKVRLDKFRMSILNGVPYPIRPQDRQNFLSVNGYKNNIKRTLFLSS